MAGYCQTHKINKDQVLWEHCQRGEVVFLGENKLVPPSLLKRATNYAIALGKHILNGGTEVSEKVYNERIAICRACPLFDAISGLCSSCGCPIEKKCRFPTEKCPLPEPKWGVVKTKNIDGCGSCGKS